MLNGGIFFVLDNSFPLNGSAVLDVKEGTRFHGGSVHGAHT